ncbi:MAG TPA: hypothetical protein VLZ06_12585 [Solirubrobacteraceae bacterium]|nr:hypothetical protein [Solirubrobacteraceae bacterium]
MPDFCRHNRFVERCPICGREQAQARAAAAPAATRRRTPAKPGARRTQGRAGAQTPEALRVRREQRALRDGFGCELVPGLGSTADAARLAGEIAFATGRLKLLASAPPGLYGQLRALAAEDLERATWGCFLNAYLSPLQGGDPFESIARALSGSAGPGEPPELAGLELGPRSSHDPARAGATLLAYRHWAGDSQVAAFRGDPSWTPERRFERIFERLALPGFGRMGRYELLVTLGRLGLYELRGEDLRLGAGRSAAGEDLCLAGAKRVFGIGDPLLLERRAGALAGALEVPVEALDLALANWQAGERATLGIPEQTTDEGVLRRAGDVLGL